MGTHRSRPGAPYRVYVSDGGRESRRRRRRRLRRLLFTSLLVLIAAGVFAAGGWAEDVWDRFAGPASAREPVTAGATASPAAFGVLITGVTHAAAVDPPPPIDARGDGVKVSTFLGDETRRLYGLGPPPDHLSLIWKTTIGSGLTSGVRKKGDKPNKPIKPATWSGTGWTGQPAIIKDKSKLYLVVGGFDHDLHKIEMTTGKVVWEYAFDDIIKSSPTVIEDPRPDSRQDKYLVLSGSRRGFPSDFTRPEPRPVPRRLVRHGQGGLAPARAAHRELQPRRGRQRLLLQGPHVRWGRERVVLQARPLRDRRLERRTRRRRSSPSACCSATRATPQRTAATSCSRRRPACWTTSSTSVPAPGHVYGMRRSDLKVVWDYRTGSDLDGTPVPTSAGKLLVPVEKQYISGHGGVLMLDPSKDPADSVVWFFPTGDRTLADWEGGVIGSVAVNDSYDPWGRRPRLAAFIAIDGNLYVVSQNRTSGEGPGPNGDGPWPTPRVVAKFYVGGGIGTPIMVDDSIVAAGYDNQGPPVRHRVQEGRQGSRRSPQEPRRRLVHGHRGGEGLLQRRRRLREHAGHVERQGVHRLARRLALLPRRRLRRASPPTSRARTPRAPPRTGRRRGNP